VVPVSRRFGDDGGHDAVLVASADPEARLGGGSTPARSPDDASRRPRFFSFPGRMSLDRFFAGSE
jgi:hypothetical protein